MASVSQLGYVGVGTSDAKAWQDPATNILGMQVVPGDDKSTSYLRMDEYRHRLELRSGGRDDLEFVGWEVADHATPKIAMPGQGCWRAGISSGPAPRRAPGAAAGSP